MVLAAAAHLQAAVSSHFSTVPGTEFAWQLSRTGGNWLLSFPVNTSQIDFSNPADAVLLGDYVNLPTMALSDLQDHGAFFTAVLTPAGSLSIVGNPGGQTALTASMKQGNALFIGTNYVAFSNIADDLDVTSHLAGYSPVIDDIAASDARGLAVDISFSGDVAGGVDLVSALRSSGPLCQFNGSSLSGQITVIPVPGAMLLVGIGTAAVGSLRRRLLS
jgi:hypothetical protein